MQIDRTKFLFLASALTASCTIVERPAPQNSGVAATPNTTPAETTATPTTTTASTVAPHVESITPVSEGRAGPDGKLTPFNAGTCNDDVGSPQSCANLGFDKSCDPFPFVTNSCNAAVSNYKAHVAEKAVTCIHKTSGKKLCDAMNTYRCKDEALHAACVDPAADAPCQQIVSVCKNTNMTECRGYLSGMNAKGRAEMVKCMQNNCKYTMYACTEGI